MRAAAASVIVKSKVRQLFLWKKTATFFNRKPYILLSAVGGKQQRYEIY